MKPLILSFFIIHAFIPGYAQNTTTDTSATCVAYWRKGDHKVFSIAHTKEKFLEGKTKGKTTLSYEAHLTVLDSTEKGYTLQWTHKNYHSEAVDDGLMGSINALMDGLDVVYKTDDVGSFGELINWEHVRDFYLQRAKSVIKNAEPQAKAAMEQTISMFQSKESVEATLIREIQLYHAPFGVEYSLAGQTTETLLHNITGGEPFPARFDLRLEKIDLSGRTCAIEMNQTIDKIKGRTILIDMLQKLSPSTFKKEEVEKEIKNLDMTDKHEYTLDLETGWLSKASLTRIVNIGAAANIETYEIVEKVSPSL